MVARPACAFATEARKTSAAERVKPWPYTATGKPPAGAGPPGSTAMNGSRSEPVGAGPSSLVGVCAIVTSSRSQDGAR